MKAWTDVMRRVGDEGTKGAALTLGPGQDGFGVKLSTETEADKYYFGVFLVTLSKELAEQLGHALIAASKECEG